jgi:organic hydroperoxide reductase OsmC/OhrA
VERLTGEAQGEIELEDNVLVIRRIHVVYQVAAPEDARATIERVHGFHHDKCPIYRSISKAIAITTEYKIGRGD